jgi:hypothetical protein
MSDAPGSTPETDNNDAVDPNSHSLAREKRYTDLKVRMGTCMNGSMHAAVVVVSYYHVVVYFQFAVGHPVAGYR